MYNTKLLLWIMVASYTCSAVSGERLNGETIRPTDRPETDEETDVGQVTRTDSDEKRRHLESRKRRYAYDDSSEWEYDDNFDYDEDSEETKKWKSYLQNWDKIGLRVIYLGSTVLMITCCCCCCCRKACGLVCDGLCHSVHVMCDRCLCRDPLYRNIKSLSEQLGIEMDYDTFKQLKGGYKEDMAEQGFKVKL